MSIEVTIDQPEHMNLAGLLFAGFLSGQLSSPKLARRASRIRGAFGFQVGQMQFTVTFRKDSIHISQGFATNTRARVAGPLSEITSLITGPNTPIIPLIAVLEGRLQIRGNPFALLRLMPIMLRKKKPNP
ncbi:MAG: SCP2 sterol-binding domain-containing protein [Polyangiaceae bacterium]|nr:SCP2 sterol-binding domain-containing protein [Polyangiaceae bacterium]